LRSVTPSQEISVCEKRSPSAADPPKSGIGPSPAAMAATSSSSLSDKPSTARKANSLGRLSPACVASHARARTVWETQAVLSSSDSGVTTCNTAWK